MNEFIQKEFGPLHCLLSSERVKETLQECPTLMPAEDLGALAGWGFATHDGTVMISVYLFQSWEPHAASVKWLKKLAPQNNVEVLSSTNGGLLFFGYAHLDGSDDIAAQFRLYDCASTFAGDE